MVSISGLVLSVGEKTTKESIKRLEAQTIPVKRIILIKDVRSWAKAFSLGLSKVHTEFFINCDADMLLYPDCIERLLKYMRSDVGLVVGRLKDPLYGTVLGIRLFRTESLKSLRPSEKSVIPDTDLFNGMQKVGWKKVYADKDNLLDGTKAEVVGLHCPEYTPIYTYKKFKMLGIRIAKRGNLKSLYLHWNPLKRNSHPMAKVALVALSTGLFSVCDKNMLDFSDIEEEFNSIKNLLNKITLKCNREDNLINLSFLKEDASPGLLFKKSFSIGKELRAKLALDKFNNLLRGLLNSENRYSCFGVIGLCYRFFYNPNILNIDIHKEWLKISHIKC